MSAVDEYFRRVADKAIRLAAEDPFRLSYMHSILVDAASLASNGHVDLAVEVLVAWQSASARLAEGGEVL